MLAKALCCRPCKLTAAARFFPGIALHSLKPASLVRGKHTTSESSSSKDFKLRHVQQDGRRDPSHDKRKKDQFYKFYLKLGLDRKFAPHPNIWLKTLDAAALRQAVPSNFQHEPLAILADHNAEIDHVRIVLESFIADGLAKSDDRERYVSALVGTRALKWLLDANLHKKLDLKLEPRFTRALMHCIVGERQHEFIWQWLKTEHVPVFARTWPLQEVGHVRSLLLAELIKSTACCDGLDAAVQNFHRAREWDRTLPRGRKIIIAWPGLWLVKRLRRPISPSVTAWS